MIHTVTKAAIGARIATLVLAAVSLYIAGLPYDTSSDHALRIGNAIRAEIEVPIADASLPDRKPGDAIIDALLGCLIRWDAVYFLDVAEAREYRYEQGNAFLPGLPFLANAVSAGVHPPIKKK